MPILHLCAVHSSNSLFAVNATNPDNSLVKLEHSNVHCKLQLFWWIWPCICIVCNRQKILIMGKSWLELTWMKRWRNQLKMKLFSKPLGPLELEISENMSKIPPIWPNGQIRKFFSKFLVHLALFSLCVLCGHFKYHNHYIHNKKFHL